MSALVGLGPWNSLAVTDEARTALAAELLAAYDEQLRGGSELGYR